MDKVKVEPITTERLAAIDAERSNVWGAMKILVADYDAIRERLALAEAVANEALSLRDSGYDGPFIGEPVEGIFTALAAYEGSISAKKRCPNCGESMNFERYHDLQAYQCKECIFSRWLPDGTEQMMFLCCVTGEISWKAVEKNENAKGESR